MNRRTAARLGWSLFALGGLLFVIALVLNLRRPQYASLAFTTGELVLGLVLLLFGWFGALIVSRRPGHPIGWLLCAFGIVAGLTDSATEYAIYGLLTRPGAVPAAGAAAWLASWLFATELALLAALLALFPSGRPPSPPWRGVLWLAGLGGGLAVVGALALWPLRGISLLQLDTPDPAGVLGSLYNVGFWAAMAALFGAVAALVVRFRRSQGAERQQIKWLVYAVLVIVLCFPLPSVFGSLIGSELAADVVYALLVAPIPIAVGVAILRYRLYDIDRLINRTLVYGLLTALLGSLYAAGVFVFGRLLDPAGGRSELAVAASTLAVAALFQPARRRVQTAVDRRFNRSRYDAARTVEAFSARLREQVDLDTLSAELLALVDQTMEPTRASLWLRPSA